MIKTVENEQDLKRLFDFLAKIFYEDAVKYKEHYYVMGERFEEMKTQYNLAKDMLMYIEKDGRIIAGITGKNMKETNITMGILGVDENERNKGLAKELVSEFEKRCLENGITHIDLGSRNRAASLYKKLGYKVNLMIQVYDFATIEDIRKANNYNLQEKKAYQNDTYGFIIYDINKIDEEYIKHFEDNVKTAMVQYIFEKDLLSA